MFKHGACGACAWFSRVIFVGYRSAHTWSTVCYPSQHGMEHSHTAEICSVHSSWVLGGRAGDMVYTNGPSHNACCGVFRRRSGLLEVTQRLCSYSNSERRRCAPGLHHWQYSLCKCTHIQLHYLVQWLALQGSNSAYGGSLLMWSASLPRRPPSCLRVRPDPFILLGKTWPPPYF